MFLTAERITTKAITTKAITTKAITTKAITTKAITTKAITTRMIVGLSALLSAGFVAGLVVVEASARARAQAPKIEERHPDLSGLPASVSLVPGQVATTVATKRSDRLAEAADCAAQSWPYVAKECVNGAGRQPVRTITIEQRVGESTSVLLRVPGQLARN